MSQQILPSMYIHSKAQQLYIYMQVNTKTECIIRVHILNALQHVHNYYPACVSSNNQ